MNSKATTAMTRRTSEGGEIYDHAETAFNLNKLCSPIRIRWAWYVGGAVGRDGMAECIRLHSEFTSSMILYSVYNTYN